MYNTKIECTYNTSEIFLETDNITNDEEMFIRNVIYRQELLDIFGLEDFNELNINDAIEDLYELIKESEDLKMCFSNLANKIFSNDKKSGFVLLFAFDYMYISHLCISEYLEKNNISKKNIDKLKELIN
jgi:hypothetical protein